MKNFKCSTEIATGDLVSFFYKDMNDKVCGSGEPSHKKNI